MVNIKQFTQARSSPFYDAYISQKTEIDLAIDHAINAGTEKLNDKAIKQLFSITPKNISIKKAA